MTTVLAWLGVACGALLGAVAAMTLVGWCLPVRHVASRSILVPVPITAVWAALVDFPGQTTWRRGLTAVERLPDRTGGAVWRETSGRHVLICQTIEAEASHRLVRAITTEQDSFQGRWEFLLEPVINPTTTRLTLTEQGAIMNPFGRFVNRYLMGQAATLVGYLEDLAHRFGTEPRFFPSMQMQREADTPPT